MRRKTKTKHIVRTIKTEPLVATIWKSHNEGNIEYYVEIEKTYLNSEGNLTSTTLFTTGDLPAIAWLIQQTFEYIIKKRTKHRLLF